MDTEKTCFANGYRLFAFKDRESLIRYLDTHKGILIAMNAEKIMTENTVLCKIINRNIGYADGIGAVWVLKRKGFKHTSRIPGCELWLDVIHCFHKDRSFYLVGSTQKVIKKAVQKLKELYPEMNIINFRNGYIKSENENEDLMNDIKTKKPDIVLVAMGSPRQELLMDEMFNHHPAIYQGLGGSLDVFVGKLRRAGTIYQKLGLEWLYRLIRQPKRIKRQIIYMKFIILLLLKKI
jgi:UDP-N-acetyl-D-mannosaminouronate:lipid I N-acetyl-D-mannosaminouronosyltransferase